MNTEYSFMSIWRGVVWKTIYFQVSACCLHTNQLLTSSHPLISYNRLHCHHIPIDMIIGASNMSIINCMIEIDEMVCQLDNIWSLTCLQALFLIYIQGLSIPRRLRLNIRERLVTLWIPRRCETCISTMLWNIQYKGGVRPA